MNEDIVMKVEDTQKYVWQVHERVSISLPTDKYPDKYKLDLELTEDDWHPIKVKTKKLFKTSVRLQVRWVTNFYVCYVVNEKEELIENLHNFPMEIRVKQESGDGDTLCWLDPRDGQVKKLITTLKKVGSDIYGFANVLEWGDPNIGWV